MNIRVSFTGYRPSKLPFGFDEKSVGCIKLKAQIYSTIRSLCDKGAKQFYSGMAMGVDIWCAEAVLSLQSDFPDIELVCALPCENQDDGWSESYKARYTDILLKAERVIFVNREYSRNCMKERNEFLVKHCDILVAVYDGKSGGTKQTVNMAEKAAKKVIYIVP